MDIIYFISGLGADYRLFNNIRLQGYEVIYVHWIEPEKHDTLTSYATKLIERYRIEPGSAVAGVSLGGLLAIEIAKQVKLAKTILISSIKTSDEAPWYFSLFRTFPVYKLIPAKWMTSVGFLIHPVFGKMIANDLKLFKSMLSNSSPTFVKWAMGAVLRWKSTVRLPNVYQIVGDKDLVFDHKRIKGAHIVKGGTHIMVFDKAAEITNWLIDIVKK